jgi:hypothetical protein
VLADLILEVVAFRSFGSLREINGSLAVRDVVIGAVSKDSDGLDALRSAATALLETPDLTLQPAPVGG